jgi:hypothetical protein
MTSIFYLIYQYYFLPVGGCTEISNELSGFLGPQKGICSLELLKFFIIFFPEFGSRELNHHVEL